MKQSIFRKIASLTGAVAFAAVVVAGSAGNASAAFTNAGTAAEGKITNLASASFFDAAGKGSTGVVGDSAFSAVSAKVEVKVLLKAAAPSITLTSSNAPAAVASGATQTFTYDVWANANGGDNYTLTAAETISNLASTSYAITVKDSAGVDAPSLAVAGSGATFNVGAISIVDNTANTIRVPVGAFEAVANSINGVIQDGLVFVIDGVKYKYVAAGYSAGTAASVAGSTLTPETPATVTFVKASDDSSPGWTVGALKGATASVYYVLTYAITADSSFGGSDGTDAFTLTLKSTATAAATTDSGSATGTWNGSTLSIVKTVKNQAGDDISVATGSGGAKPGDVLYYRLTITLSGSPATKVDVTDVVPKYTKLLSYDTAGDFTATPPVPSAAYDNTKIVARIERTAGADLKAVYLTGNNNAETQGGGAVEVGFGETSGAAPAAGSALIIHLGDDSTKDAGGKVLKTETYIIDYRVQVL